MRQNKKLSAHKTGEISDAPPAEAEGFFNNAASRDECAYIHPSTKAGEFQVARTDHIDTNVNNTAT